MNQQRVEEVKQQIIKQTVGRTSLGDLMNRVFRNEHNPKATLRYVREALKQLVAKGQFSRTTSAAIGGNAGNMAIWAPKADHEAWLRDCQKFTERMAEVYGVTNA